VMKNGVSESDSVATVFTAGFGVDQDDQLLDRLVELWTCYQTHGLEVRWRVGAELNGRLGAPVERQPYGRAILKVAAERLEVSESELSRMRWFAHHFTSLADLQARHPAVDSWAKVKELLPSLNPKKVEKDESSPSTGRTSKAFITGFIRSLRIISDKLRRAEVTPDDKDRTMIRESLQELLEVAREHFQLEIEIVANNSQQTVTLPAAAKAA